MTPSGIEPATFRLLAQCLNHNIFKVTLPQNYCNGGLTLVFIDRKMCILYNQRDATYTKFFIIIGPIHVSGGFSAHHQEFIKLLEQF